jgi:hypothetical protein
MSYYATVGGAMKAPEVQRELRARFEKFSKVPWEKWRARVRRESSPLHPEFYKAEHVAFERSEDPNRWRYADALSSAAELLAVVRAAEKLLAKDVVVLGEYAGAFHELGEWVGKWKGLTKPDGFDSAVSWVLSDVAGRPWRGKLRADEAAIVLLLAGWEPQMTRATKFRVTDIVEEQTRRVQSAAKRLGIKVTKRGPGRPKST